MNPEDTDKRRIRGKWDKWDKWEWLLEGAWRWLQGAWWWLDVFVRLLSGGVLYSGRSGGSHSKWRRRHAWPISPLLPTE